uniref:Uncharacterized protein n=1 Tax=Anopheles dirus TaxID=7168 RepID=A0A182NR71_9DIPT
MVRIRKQASVAEVFRHRLMACGLITTKSPERWRDRLIAELDEIISEIEQRCAVCNSLYEEPCRYEMLRSLIDPCPACRRKNTKKRLLLTLQKVLEKALDGKPEAAESGVVHEDEPNDANIWPITDIPKSRKTRSTTEIPLDLTTTVYGNTREEANHAAIHNYKLKTPSWWSHHEHTTGTANLSDKTVEPIPGVNYTGVNEDAAEPTVAQVINGQRVDNIHDFLQQYMNLVYGGHPGNEQRKQFFLDQLCRNATNGTIVLQCKDNGGQRKARSPAPAATKKVSARNN